MKPKLWLALFLMAACGLTAMFWPVKTTDYYMDTTVTINISGVSRSRERRLVKQCFSLCGAYEKLWSRNIAGNEIDRLNNGETVAVSDPTLALLKKAIYYYDLSEGAFDITVTPLLNLWNVSPEQTHVPSDAGIAEALTHVGSDNIQIDGYNVTLLNGAQIDLGAVAKGEIGEIIRQYLVSEGVEHAIVVLGGNVVAIGDKTDGTPWAVGVRQPFGKANELAGVMDITNEAIDTSGRYERYFMKDGQLYHHVMDTKTGRPVDNGLDSVTVIYPNSGDADILSTACFALGLEHGMLLLRRVDGAEGIFITSDGQIVKTPGIGSKFKALK